MTPSSAASAVLAGLNDIRDEQEGLYRTLHQQPELSHQEHRTATMVSRWLERAGFQVHHGIGGDGVVGVLANGEGPTVLLRADMDALPVREQTGLPYASTATGTESDGDAVPVMHACGHDVHVTCLLGACQVLAGDRDGWSGTLVVVFQPAAGPCPSSLCSSRPRSPAPEHRRWSTTGCSSASPTRTWSSASTSRRSPPGGWPCGPVPPSRVPTASGSRSSAAAGTARVPRPPSTLW